jgi:hypothetical protein
MGLIVGAALVAVATIGFVLVSVFRASPPERSYSQFLDEVAAGRVDHVTQVGASLHVESGEGRYDVQAPSILTDVFHDLQVATGGQVPPFEAQPAPDASWLSVWPIVAANVALVLAVIALVISLQRRRPGQPT